MTLLLLILLDIIFKVLSRNTLFFALPFLLIYFINGYKNFWILFILSSIINDFMLYLPIGFTGLVLGSFFVFLIIIQRFITFETKSSLFYLNFFLQLIFTISLLYFLKINSFYFFVYFFISNLLLSTFIILIYRVLY